ncbi:ParB/RepB/Spo0J family partition protein [Kitasatospora sp. NPDC096147]|uniref:ParB/RepB/Spo0J family partition protein n=1 Tax=Kitasatospora sp. NPDC096147 TaxID=3364093 RepID=UPI0038296177
MTTTADRLGAGGFGSLATRTHRSERGRAKAIAEGTLPGYELLRIELTKVTPTPVNPRKDFGTEAEQLAFGESLAVRQLTPCVAVTVDAYRRLWPEHRLVNPGAEYVILNGERRFQAARFATLDRLDFVVRDDLATSRADFLDNLLLENEDRNDFNVIERARGIRDLLGACEGNAAEVARRRGRDRSWVGNQVALLTLPQEIQHMLITGTMAERYARRLARALKEDTTLTVEALLRMESDLREAERDRRGSAKALLEAARATTADPAPVLSADNTAADRTASLPQQTSAGSAAPRTPGAGPDLTALLGGTAGEQAAVLRAHLDDDGFLALVEALRALL